MASRKAAVSNTFVGLQKTISWDIRNPFPGKGRVPIPEWLEFLREDVGIDLEDITSALQHTITGTLLVQMPTEEKFKEILTKAEKGVLWQKYNVTVYGWSAGEEVINVHLHNIFATSDLKQAVEVMGKYGTVVAMETHYYKQAPTVKNGIVTLKMRVSAQAELPTFIYEENMGNTIEITSEKHQRTCWKCLETGHIAAFCRSTMKTQETAAATPTWAKIVAGSSSKEIARTAEILVNMELEPTANGVAEPTTAPAPEQHKEPETELVMPEAFQYNDTGKGTANEPEKEKHLKPKKDNKNTTGKQRSNVRKWIESPTEKQKVLQSLKEKKQRMASK